MPFIETPAHTAIFDALKRKDRNLIIDAKAGSGKTTTIIEGLKHVEPDENCIFLAFNKSIATELSSRVPDNCVAKTLNALGHGMWMSHLKFNGEIKHPRQMKVDADKVLNLAADFCEDKYGWDRSPAYKMGHVMKKLIGLGKSNGVGAFEENEAGFWRHLIEYFDVTWDEDVFTMRDVIDTAIDVCTLSNETLTTIDFNDQLLLPVIHNARPKRFDRVLVDESQDLSRLQHELVAKILKPDGQLIAVGDPHQAIYGFRGADSSSMDRLRARFDCETLPLSVTYRCGHKIVEKAQKYVPGIEAREGAHSGTVGEKVEAVADMTHKLEAGDLVVSRTTAPAVAMCYELIRERKRARVLGREIGQGLIKLMRDAKPRDMSDLPDALRRWEEKEIKRLEKRNASDSQIAAVYDKTDCVRVLSEDCDTMQELEALIEDMFTGLKNNRTITLCTIHKSKGLEAERVWILNPHLLPHPMARKPWERQQEDNLAYVAITRAKNHLGYCAYER